MFDLTFHHSPTVTLIRHMGGDLGVIQAMSKTAGKERDVMPSWGEARISEMLRLRHGTPFEEPVFTFSVTTTIRVAREWFRHRIGSFNEFSLRVAKAKPNFFIPAPTAVRRELSRYEFEDAPDLVDTLTMEMESVYRKCWSTYLALVKVGVAKELAANVLPMGMMTEFRWTVNARALMNFLSLRLAADAMKEIRDAAIQVDRYFKNEMPLTHRAFVFHGRQAP